MALEGQGRVAGKVAIITGAARGLGEADARRLAAEGAHVVITDIDVEVGKETAKAIGGVFMQQDVRDEQRWKEVIAETVERFGRLDILVNNAGLVDFTSVADSTLEKFRFVNAVMVEGTFLGCQNAIPAMAKSGGGSIINVSSIAANRGMGPIVSYTAAKGAILSMTRSIAAHCLEVNNNVRCNVIVPGSHETDMTKAAIADLTDEQLADSAKNNTMGKPDDVGNLVLYLASDESRFLNGSDIVIDNGESM
jgi:3(or 17)beta-hydroxysteroid dehydrogenase